MAARTRSGEAVSMHRVQDAKGDGGARCPRQGEVMTVAELIAKLQEAPPDTPVLFDTEAALFHVHMVDIDGCFYEPDAGVPPFVGLHTRAPREHIMDAEIAHLRAVAEAARMCSDEGMWDELRAALSSLDKVRAPTETRREILPFGPHEDPSTCDHVWEPHSWEQGKRYCPYCATTAPSDDKVSEP